MQPPNTAPLEQADRIADRLSVTRARVYELVNHPDSPLPAYRIGRSLRFDLAEVEEWLASQRKPVPIAPAER